MHASNRIRNNLSNFCCTIKMAKAKVPKLLKPRKSKDEDEFVIRFRNLDREKIKEVRAALVQFVDQFQFREKLSPE